MKSLLYKIFALFFRLGRKKPVIDNRVVLLAPHPGGSHDSLAEIAEYLKKKGGYEIINICVPRSGIKNYIDFFFIQSKALARAKYIFLNDNFMPMADLDFSEDTVITQLWHGEGAFKKFGLLTNLDDDIAQRLKKCTDKLSFITCTSENVKPIYAKAFGADESKVIPCGSPRTDFLYNNDDTKTLRNNFDSQFPSCKGKKLVLYAPTFRDNPEKDKALLDNVSTEIFNKELGDEYSLLIKLHPRIHTAEIPDGAIDVTSLDVANLTLICDILITDYSSICMDFAFLSKPCIFYAFDLDEYEDDRSFCCGYEEYVPGPVIKEFKDIPNAVRNPSTDKLVNFRDFNFDYIDGNNTERVINRIIK